MHKTRYWLLLVAIALFALAGCGGSSEPETVAVQSVEVAEDPTEAPAPTDVPTEVPAPTDVPLEVTEPAEEVAEAEEAAEAGDDVALGGVTNGVWANSGDPYPETDIALIGATGQPQFVNAYTNW